MTRVQELREHLQLDPAQLAATLGVTLREYYDIEDHDDELETSVAIRIVVRLAKELHVKPSYLYGGSSTRVVTLEELATEVRSHLQRTAKPLQDFEDEVGWGLEEALGDPMKFLGFPATCLRDVSVAIGVSWFDVLDGLENR